MGPDEAAPREVPFFERFLERIEPAEGSLRPTPTRRDDFMPSV